jgi:hypothetical protein
LGRLAAAAENVHLMRPSQLSGNRPHDVFLHGVVHSIARRIQQNFYFHYFSKLFGA